jgi:hypothetical protein
MSLASGLGTGLGDFVDRERLMLQLRLVRVAIDSERRRGRPMARLARRGSEIVETAAAGIDVSEDPELTETLTAIRRELAELSVGD